MSKNLGATAVAPVAPAVTSMLMIVLFPHSSKFFKYVTKTRANLTTYSRKPENYNDFVFGILRTCNSTKGCVNPMIVFFPTFFYFHNVYLMQRCLKFMFIDRFCDSYQKDFPTVLEKINYYTCTSKNSNVFATIKQV